MHHRSTPLLTPVVSIALLAITAVATVRAVAGPIASESPSIDAPPPSRVAPPVDGGSRQIVASHPIIPLPTAAWPALVGVGLVARRVLRSTARSSARYR